jgi:hypothetical protein
MKTNTQMELGQSTEHNAPQDNLSEEQLNSRIKISGCPVLNVKFCTRCKAKQDTPIVPVTVVDSVYNAYVCKKCQPFAIKKIMHLIEANSAACCRK